jgi:hypothetical protein
MYVTLPGSSGSVNLAVFTDENALFNPKHNKFFKQNATAADFRALLPIVFSRANVTHALPSMWRYYQAWVSRGGNNATFMKRTIDHIADDKMWVLNWVAFDGFDGERAMFTWYYPGYDNGNSSVFAWECDAQNKTYPGSWDTGTFETWFSDTVDEYARKWEAIFTNSRANALVHENQSCGINQSLSLVLKFVTDTKLISDTGGQNYLRPSEVESLSPDGIELKITTGSFDSGRGVEIRLKLKASRNNKTMLHRILSYNANPCDHIKWPIVEKNEHKPVLYGVELEVSTDYTMVDLIDATDDPFFIGKSDSSITGSKRTSVELVTAPMSYKAQRRYWAQWFKKLDYSKFDCTNQTHNGMHVHIDRTAFDDDNHIRAMAWFITNPANKDFIVFVSERGSYAAMEQYSAIAKFPNTLSRIRAFKQCTSIARTIRGAINFGKPATVEIRLFRGIVSLAELFKNLEFTDSMFHFTREMPRLKDLSVYGYLAWLRGTADNRYTILKKFLAHGNMEDIQTAAQVYDVVFNETDPDRMVELLKKSGMTLTNAHIAVLNKGRKRTFLLDKETGEINIKYTNRSKLYELDRPLENRYSRFNNAA